MMHAIASPIGRLAPNFRKLAFLRGSGNEAINPILLNFLAMKHSRYTRVIVLLLVLSPLLSSARADLNDLYAAEVPVENDSPSVRNQALGSAMAKVLVRLSGRTDVLGHPEAAAVTARAPSLVQQFRYRIEQDPDEPAPATAQRYLWAKFDKVALDRLLRDSDIPVWGGRRPRVLLWLAVERNGERNLLNFETNPATRDLAQSAADERGVPLQLPLLDLIDQAALGPADLWAGYEAAIREASARYSHDIVLTGRLRELGDERWAADWTLWTPDGQDDYSQRGLNLGAALQAGLNVAQDRLAARYAPSVGGDGPERLRVRFNGVDTLQAYGRLMRILDRLEVVSRLNLRGADSLGLSADLWVIGGASALSRSLALGGELFLQPAQEGLSPATEGVVSPSGMPIDMTFSFLPRVSGDLRLQ